MNPVTAEKLLKALLRLTGAVMLLAVFALFMPRSWMAWTHEWLGLGPFPSAPIAEHLARLTSGLYALLGGLIWMSAGDIARYSVLIAAIAVGLLILSASTFAYGWSAGIPPIALECDLSSTVAFAATVLALQHWAGKQP